MKVISEKKRIDFTEQEFLKGKNKADLAYEGDFSAFYLIADFEDKSANRFIAMGEHQEIGKDPKKVTLFVITAEDFTEDLTAGEIFNLPWDEWQV